MDALKRYEGPGRRVVVYDTYAGDGKIHFDVFLVTDETSVAAIPSEQDAQARRVAERFLELIGADAKSAVIERCRKCHIDDTSAYDGELWDLGSALVWPMEGCP